MQMPYSQCTSVKADSVHQAVCLPLDPLDQIFVSSSSYDPAMEDVKTRGKLHFAIENVEPDSTFVLVVDTVIEYLPTSKQAPFVELKSSKPIAGDSL